jgi:hypothetical protein
MLQLAPRTPQEQVRTQESPALGCVNGRKNVSAPTANEETDEDCDNIVVVKRGILPTPAPTIFTVTEHEEACSSRSTSCHTTHLSLETNALYLTRNLSDQAHSLLPRRAFATPQRSHSPALLMPQHETILVIDDEYDDGVTEPITNNPHHASLPQPFSQQQIPKVITQEREIHEEIRFRGMRLHIDNV